MSSLVARLVDHGLVRRETDPHDARAVRLSLTAAGEALVAERRTARTRRLDTALAELSSDDVALIAGAVPALVRLADALRRSTKEVSR
jgi:DNA-binding MarR family transcriptional regulator